MNLETKYLFLDLDGVCVDFVNNEGGVIIKDFNEPGLFINRRPCYTMINIILELFGGGEYSFNILSASPNETSTQEKNDWLDKHLPIHRSKRHFVKFPGECKGEYLRQYCQENSIDPKDCLLIDDTLAHLVAAEKIGVKAMHPIHVICEYESILEKKKERTR